MNQYHKIQTVYKRDEKTKKLIEGTYSMPEFEYLKDNLWVATEKVDGTNIRMMWNGADVVFGGKTDNAMIPAPLLNRLHELFFTTPKKKLLREMFNDPEGEPPQVCLYGEGYGPKIQSGGKYKDNPDFVLFDVSIGDMWLERHNVEDIAEKLDIEVVPIVNECTLVEAVSIVEAGFLSKWGEFVAEGLVLKPKTELKTRRGHRVITKIKNRDFNHNRE